MSDNPAILRVYQNLAYEIVITCPPGETWPRLMAGTNRYEVVQVEIRVAVYTSGDHEPVLDTGPAYVTGGNLVRVNGTLGRETRRRLPYQGTGREGDLVDAQAERLDGQARRAARLAYYQFIKGEAGRMAARPPAR